MPTDRMLRRGAPRPPTGRPRRTVARPGARTAAGPGRRPRPVPAPPSVPSPPLSRTVPRTPLQRTVHPVYFGGVRTPGTVRPAPQNLCRAAPEEAARGREKAGRGRTDRQAEGRRRGRRGRGRAAQRTVRRGLASASSRLRSRRCRRRRLGPCAFFRLLTVSRRSGVPVFSGVSGSGPGVPSWAVRCWEGVVRDETGEAGDVGDIG